jgi:hypothetical protein
MDVRPATRGDIPICRSAARAHPALATAEDSPGLRDSLIRQIVP